MKNAWIDSHNHLSDPRLDQSREAMIESAKQAGVQFFLQGGVGPEDWQRQKLLSQQHPEVLMCFGLHPYWVAENDEATCEAAMNQLAKEIGAANVHALGELGLDFRPHIMGDSQNRQVEYFELQLELAELSGKPIVLHLVQAFDWVKKIFSLRHLPARGGLVHSFNGSLPQAEFYWSRGLYLSVGGPVLYPNNQKLHQAVAEIPMEFLLVETDSPDQPPPELKGGFNEPRTLLSVAEKIAEIKKIKAAEVLDRSSANLRKLLQL